MVSRRDSDVPAASAAVDSGIEADVEFRVVKKPRKPKPKQSSRAGLRPPAPVARASFSATRGGGRLTTAALAGGSRARSVAIGLQQRDDERRSLAVLLAPVLLVGVLLSSQSALRRGLGAFDGWRASEPPQHTAHREPMSQGRSAGRIAHVPLPTSVPIPPSGNSTAKAPSTAKTTVASVDIAPTRQPPPSELTVAALDLGALPKPQPLPAEVGVASLDLGVLPRPLPAEVAVASLDIARLPLTLPAEVAIASLDISRLPLPLPAELVVPGLDVATLPPPLPAETSVVTLDVAALPSPLPAEVAVASLDVAALPPPAPANRRGYLMGPRLPRPALSPAPGLATPAALPPLAPPVIAPSPFATCQPSADVLAALSGKVTTATPPVIANGEAFGVALAQAAQRQTLDLVIYDAKYTRISYPLGDVSPLYGVCTDVVVRAYRVLGFDLQEMVQKAKAGRGDRSIDHRRTEVLRRYFAGQGASLPVTDLPEDYRPGDIVTYYRPFNTSSVAHIAVVSNVMAPSGRLMVVHNRGWGPQLEDALFADQITGHYRFHPLPRSGGAITARSKAPAAPKVVRRPLCPPGSTVSSEAGIAHFCAPAPSTTAAAPGRPSGRTPARFASAKRN